MRAARRPGLDLDPAAEQRQPFTHADDAELPAPHLGMAQLADAFAIIDHFEMRFALAVLKEAHDQAARLGVLDHIGDRFLCDAIEDDPGRCRPAVGGGIEVGDHFETVDRIETRAQRSSDTEIIEFGRAKIGNGGPEIGNGMARQCGELVDLGLQDMRLADAGCEVLQAIAEACGQLRRAVVKIERHPLPLLFLRLDQLRDKGREFTSLPLEIAEKRLVFRCLPIEIVGVGELPRHHLQCLPVVGIHGAPSRRSDKHQAKIGTGLRSEQDAVVPRVCRLAHRQLLGRGSLQWRKPEPGVRCSREVGKPGQNFLGSRFECRGIEQVLHFDDETQTSRPRFRRPIKRPQFRDTRRMRRTCIVLQTGLLRR